MRVIWAAVVGVAVAVAGEASAQPGLRTPWPARADCPSYSSVDLSVDDRVSAVEWRGANGASLTFDLPKLPGREGTERYALGSEGIDCVFGATSCFLYPYRAPKLHSVRAARVSKPLPNGLTGAPLDELVLHEDVRRAGRPSRTDRSLEFGLRVVLHCADASKPSIAWACDARTCVPRTFRDNVRVQAQRRAQEQKPRQERHWEPAVAGPYQLRWDKGDPARDLGRLICMRGTSGRTAAVREAEEGVHCWNGAMPAAEARPALVELARNLLVELDLVLDEGCAGACSARVEELRATAAALAAAPDLRLRGVRSVWDAGDEENPQGAFPALALEARLAAGPGAVELVCARHKGINSAGEPVVRACRLTVLARGRRLATYTPDWRQEVDLPDGGAVHVTDRATPGEYPSTGYSDRIVIIGSALAVGTR